MPVRSLVAGALLAYVAWNTRDRWAPGSVLASLGTGESDNAPDLIDQASYVTDYFDHVQTDQMIANNNVSAFLSMIEWSEGTLYAGGYQALYGSRPGALSTFSDYSDHPASLGWRGVRLTDAQCAGAGFGPGCVSTAAGRYQITSPTWKRVKRMLALQDFSPASQDLAALQLINEKGALEDVKAGRLAIAVDKVRRVWASMPGAGYAGQGERSFERVAQIYSNNGGQVAIA